ncbi:MAG: fatty acid desaturase [Planctomycetaceae bacterium]
MEQDQAVATEAVRTHATRDRWNHGLEWSAVLWLGFVHLGALAAPLFFTWKAVLVMVVMSWMTGCLGVCLGYHRLLTHTSFETHGPVRKIFAVLGTLAGEGPPLMWIAAHRKHHQFSDQVGDPHSPLDGAFWSHMLWMLPRHGSHYWAELYRSYTPDLLTEPFMRMLNRTFLLWHLGLGLILFCLGWLPWDPYTGASFVVYGMFVRLVYVLHITWLVNSASHIWGYRNYETRDDSRNLWWVGLLAFGEGWHNNHHAWQRAARHGHRWWELDVTYMTIAIMRRLGLAWNVVPVPTMGTNSLDHLDTPDTSPSGNSHEGSDESPIAAPHVAPASAVVEAE